MPGDQRLQHWLDKREGRNKKNDEGVGQHEKAALG